METTSLPTNWIECDTLRWETTTADTATITVGGTWENGADWTGYVYPYYHQYNWWPTIEKIRLTMSDVEKLRQAAKKDKTLKKVLNKLGPHIEVEVDF